MIKGIVAVIKMWSAVILFISYFVLFMWLSVKVGNPFPLIGSVFIPLGLQATFQTYVDNKD